jgi:hypothetical protein
LAKVDILYALCQTLKSSTNFVQKYFDGCKATATATVAVAVAVASNWW